MPLVDWPAANITCRNSQHNGTASLTKCSSTSIAAWIEVMTSRSRSILPVKPAAHGGVLVYHLDNGDLISSLKLLFWPASWPVFFRWSFVLPLFRSPFFLGGVF